MKIIATATSIRDSIGVQTPTEAVPFLNLLVYGEPGAGKTYLAATAEDGDDTAPILFLDVEGGVTTIRKRKTVDVKSVRSIQEVVDIGNKLFMAGPDNIHYKTVVLDSLTELQRLDMRTIMEKEFDSNPDKIDKDVATQRAWGKSRERLSRIIRHYRDLPCHTIMTALAGTEYDEGNGQTMFYPSMPGKLRGEVPGYFDVVGYLSTYDEKGEASDGKKTVATHRQIQFSKTRRVVAKDRTSSLGDIVQNPTIPLLWEMISSSE